MSTGKRAVSRLGPNIAYAHLQSAVGRVGRPHNHLTPPQPTNHGLPISGASSQPYDAIPSKASINATTVPRHEQTAKGKARFSPPDRSIVASTSPAPPGSLAASPLPTLKSRPPAPPDSKASLVQRSVQHNPHLNVNNANLPCDVQSQIQQARGFTNITENAGAARAARAARADGKARNRDDGNGKSADLLRGSSSGLSLRPLSDQYSLICQTHRRIGELKRKKEELQNGHGNADKEAYRNICAELDNKYASLSLAQQKVKLQEAAPKRSALRQGPVQQPRP